MVGPFCFAFIWFRVQGSRSGFAAFFYWAMLESGILVTSRFYDTREGTVSHAWDEILRLSPHLFWLFFSHIGRFSPLRMTIRGRG